MSNPAEPGDRVLSYIVNQGGNTTGDAELKKALTEGWRVVDVLVTAAPPDGAVVAVVTVVLTKPWQSNALPYRSWVK